MATGTGWTSSASKAWTVQGVLDERSARLAPTTPVGTSGAASADGATRTAVDLVPPRQLTRAVQHITVALLFVEPSAELAIGLTDQDNAFDQRSGRTWDLLLPGHHRPHEGAAWAFDSTGFAEIVSHVKDSTQGAWRYPAEPCLVTAQAMVTSRSHIVDWRSLRSYTFLAAQNEILGRTVHLLGRDAPARVDDGPDLPRTPFSPIDQTGEALLPDGLGLAVWEALSVVIPA